MGSSLRPAFLYRPLVAAIVAAVAIGNLSACAPQQSSASLSTEDLVAMGIAAVAVAVVFGGGGGGGGYSCETC